MSRMALTPTRDKKHMKIVNIISFRSDAAHKANKTADKYRVTIGLPHKDLPRLEAWVAQQSSKLTLPSDQDNPQCACPCQKILKRMSRVIKRLCRYTKAVYRQT